MTRAIVLFFEGEVEFAVALAHEHNVFAFAVEGFFSFGTSLFDFDLHSIAE